MVSLCYSLGCTSSSFQASCNGTWQREVLCVAVLQRTFIPAYLRWNWGINKATVSEVQSFYQLQTQCISRKLAWGPKTHRDTCKMFCLKRCLPHQRSAGLLLLTSRSESAAGKAGRGVMAVIETATSKCSSGSSESVLACVKMSSTLKVLSYIKSPVLNLQDCFFQSSQNIQNYGFYMLFLML